MKQTDTFFSYKLQVTTPFPSSVGCSPPDATFSASGQGIFSISPFLLFSFFLFSFLLSFAQSPNCYRVTFSDKNNSPYSVSSPEEYLSPRAIAKRERFNIPIIEQDLPVNPQYIDSILNFSAEPSQIISVSKWNNSVVIFYPEAKDYQGIIDDMVDYFPFVIDALPVAFYQLPIIPDKSKENISHVHKEISEAIVYDTSCDYDYGKSISHFKLHQGDLLHKAGFCGESMLICMIDSGWEGFDTISYFQPLYQNGQIWGTRDLVPGESNVYKGHAHGTATASQLVSVIEGKLIGAAPQSNYFFIRSEEPLYEQLVEEDFWAYAAEIADSLGADVLTASVAYTIFDYEWQNIYTPDDNNGIASIASRAASILAQKGVIVVNAAGNEGLTNWKYIARPADALNILAAGNINEYGEVSPTSSYGPSADGRIKPDVASVGWKGWIVWSNGQIIQNGGYGGTSGAAPLIAGLSACLWQALPQYSSLEIMDLIRKYGDRYNNPDDRTGYGIPNFYQCYLDHSNSVPEKAMPKFSVYPNPTMGELTIDNGELTIANIEIYDVFGRKQSSHTANRLPHTVLNISHLPQGIYIVKIMTDEHNYTQKIVKY